MHQIDYTNEGVIKIREYEDQVWLITKNFAKNSVNGDRINNYLNDVYINNDLAILLTSQVLRFTRNEFNSLLNLKKPLGNDFNVKDVNKLILSKGLCILERDENNILIGTIEGFFNH